MPNETFTIYITDSGVPKSGLTPTWLSFTDSDGNAETQPTISEIGNGYYKFTVDIASSEVWMGTVDAGLDVINSSERYIPVVMRRYDSLTPIRSEVYVTPMYNEDADSLMFISYLMQNGGIVDSPTNVSISLYDSTHVLKFTVSSSSSSNGVFVTTQNGPSLNSGEVYYAIASIEHDGDTHTSAETTLVLE